MPGLRLALFLSTCLALPAWSETLTLSSQVTAVTLYPQVAQVTRTISFAADKPGAFDLVVPDLPLAALPQGLRIAADAPLTIGAFTLRTDRVPPLDAPDSPDVAAARAALDAATEDLRQATQARDLILAGVQAAEAQLAFLGRLTLDAESLTPQALADLTQSLGTQALAARQAALTARAQAAPAERAVEDAQTARDLAQAALDARLSEPQDFAALTVSVDVAAPGPVTLAITHLILDAGWRPVYDLTLDDRATPPALTLGRSVLVTQYTGEDWAAVDLTLSTARPSEQAAPTPLYPYQRSILDPEKSALRGGVAESDMAFMPEATVMAPAPDAVTATADFQGVAVVYHLPRPVSVATDVEDLRLALDSLNFAPTVVAQAVPSRDATGFVVANWVNTSPEILLPGDVLLSRDGTLVGGGYFDMVPPGDKVETGFGALDGIRLTRRIPDASEGDRGVFTSSTERQETAVLKVENLTGQSWPIRLLDQVPYSEQDDLEITWSAEPAPTETDVDGGRGILAWTFDLPPGASQEITLDTRLTWPAGMELQ